MLRSLPSGALAPRGWGRLGWALPPEAGSGWGGRWTLEAGVGWGGRCPRRLGLVLAPGQSCGAKRDGFRGN